jgi:hypothetical protein
LTQRSRTEPLDLPGSNDKERKSMNMRLWFGLIVLAVLSATVQAVDDPMLGNWKLNVAKSSFKPGRALRGETNTVTAFGNNGITLVAHVTDADGKELVERYSGRFDGKPFKVTGDSAGDTCTMSRSDAYHMVRNTVKAGKVTLTRTYTVSSDGKTKTVHVKGTNDKGEAVENTLVFERQ